VPSRRHVITMTPEEQMVFLDSRLFGVLATIGPSGHPHQVTIGYARDGLDAIVMSSFAVAQKVVNVRRSQRASFLVEVAAPYGEIRGVLFAGEAAVVDDREEVASWYYRIKDRGENLPIETDLPPIDDERLLAKRVLIVLSIQHAITWDHRKLGGVY
jgi:nitroimidazol reductase NimA-like FMN-containing flavoprotein (pyridoxamine 5'-phosphate oxidase superfamily)